MVGQPGGNHLGQGHLNMGRMIRKDADILSIIVGFAVWPVESSGEVKEDVKEFSLLKVCLNGHLETVVLEYASDRLP